MGVLCTEHMKQKEGEQTPTRKRLRNYYLLCPSARQKIFLQTQRTRVKKMEAISKIKERLAELHLAQHHNEVI